MLDIAPPYLNLYAPADTAFLPNKLVLLQQPQQASARLHYLFRRFHNFCYYFLVIKEVSIKYISHRFMATVKLTINK